MKIFSTYSVKIKHYNNIFKETINIYREAVDFLIDVCLKEWVAIAFSMILTICYKTSFIVF